MRLKSKRSVRVSLFFVAMTATVAFFQNCTPVTFGTSQSRSQGKSDLASAGDGNGGGHGGDGSGTAESSSGVAAPSGTTTPPSGRPGDGSVVNPTVPQSPVIAVKPWKLVLMYRYDGSNGLDAQDPDLRYSSDVWTTKGVSVGDPGGNYYLGDIWHTTPKFTEMRWIEKGAASYGAEVDIVEAVSYDGNLMDWKKSSGMIKLNNRMSGDYGDYGGRAYVTLYNVMCNLYSNASSDWGRGFGAVRSCQSQFGTIEYGVSALIGQLPSGHAAAYRTEISLWIR